MNQRDDDMFRKRIRIIPIRQFFKHLLLRGLLIILTLGVGFGVSIAASVGSIRIALDDIPGVDMLNFLTAVENAKARGLEITVDYLRSEDIAVQAVLLDQADMGMGTPYAIIQKSNAPIRMVYQLNTLHFFPVVNSDFYTTWNDLDGADIYTHGRGSGTEAVMKSMAKKHDITYKSIQYLPGSGVRARAMLQGRITASIVDSMRRDMLLERGQGQFTVLPAPKVHVSDETLYVRKTFLDKNSVAMGILLEELLKVWRQINRNPDYMVEAWKQYGLLPSAGKNIEAEIRSYYSEMVKVGAFPDNGGGLKAVKADIEFYGYAGTLEGDVSKLKVVDFWDLKPLNRALASIHNTRSD